MAKIVSVVKKKYLQEMAKKHIKKKILEALKVES